MKTIRILFALAIVASTCTLVGILAFDKLSGTDSVLPESLSLQIMHATFLVGSIVFVAHQFQHRQRLHLSLTLLPVMAFLMALAGSIIGVKPPYLSLLIFDFYLILYYFYLLLQEMNRS